MRLWVSITTVVLAASCALCADRVIQFNRDVRPILSDKCFGCHGPDAVAKKIPLRLDSEAAARPVVAGGVQSKLVQRITAEKPASRMPPAYSGLSLTPAEIATLRRWVEQGAKWEKHWSFIPPERPPLPGVKNASWPRNPIDYFILERLDRDGLALSPEASRETLIRQLENIAGTTASRANQALLDGDAKTAV